MVGYTNNYWAGIVDDKKSTLSSIFQMGLGSISWASKKQPLVSLSKAKFEYVTAIAAACQSVWMRRMLKYLQKERQQFPMRTIFQLHCPRIMFFTKGENKYILSIISLEI